MGDTIYNPTTGNTALKFTADDKIDFIAPVKLAGTEVTATAAELNALDGITASVAELNIMDGVTATAAEINKLAGTTATTADLTRLHDTTATAVELNEYTVSCYMADANTAGSVWVHIPHAGTIAGLSVVPYIGNADTKTVFTAEIGGTLVTAPAWEIALNAAAGTKTTVAPTATNAVLADSVLELISDGGGTPVMPVMFSIKILR